MLIGGVQKMTMLDYPGKVACTIFTYGCNFRCPFCHNATLVIDEANLFDKNEILAYINKRKGILDGVVVTGGEPLLQPDIMEFLAELKQTGLLVKLDTNGSYPERLEQIIEKGLVDYVAMDIKNCKEKYDLTTGVKIDISKIEKSVELLMQDRVDYEFRTTVVKELHKKEDFEKIGKWLIGAKRLFLQPFKDNENLIGENLSSHSKESLEEFKGVLEKTIPQVEIRGL
ncbi:MAG: anaerobic ribonucleoside-triphosphate reductase activating protein [Clostridia bacterium]|nr:anaerobic ribonucleoside-triphosphate reductase activating protein [Clostridia bacterium]